MKLKVLTSASGSSDDIEVFQDGSPRVFFAVADDLFVSGSSTKASDRVTTSFCLPRRKEEICKMNVRREALHQYITSVAESTPRLSPEH
jgi:hypothetical protein